MSYCLKLLLLLLLCVRKEVELSIASRKFVYQKDMSEYCRRRVMPSVFLGRQVIDAYSQILHFSRLELPYSCFVSIRTESGSNIILVIQLVSDKSLIESCRESKNQLVVYELGETFGGYWGALPEIVMKPEPQTERNVYTVKTTELTTTTTTPSTTTPTTTTTSMPAGKGGKTPFTEHKDYIRVEVPIVNVSAELVPGKLVVDPIFDPEDSFEMVEDATWAGMSYRTKILPLMQFSVEKEVAARRTDEPDFKPRYEVEFNADMFTPDLRLLSLLGTTNKRKLHTNYSYSVNRRLNFKKNNKLFNEKEALFKKKPPSSNYRPPTYSLAPDHVFTRHYDFMRPPADKATDRPPNSWEVVNDILKKLNKTKDYSTAKIDENLLNLLQGLSKTDTDSGLDLALYS